MDLADLIQQTKAGHQFPGAPAPRAAQGGPPPRGGAGRRRAGRAERAQGQQKLREIHAAQYKAMINRLEARSDDAPKSIASTNFYGNWTDSFGNTVCVYSMDAFKSELVACLSKPPRADIHLSIFPTDGGSGWLCGNAVLSSVGDLADELTWTFPNGNVSVWRRSMDDSDALSSPSMADTPSVSDTPSVPDTPNGPDSPTSPESPSSPDPSPGPRGFYAVPEELARGRYDVSDAPIVGYVLMPFLVPAES